MLFMGDKGLYCALDIAQSTQKADPFASSLMKQPKSWRRAFLMNRLVAGGSPSSFCSHFDVNCSQFNRFYAPPPQEYETES